MPIPPVEEHTRYFEAGSVRIGVEYRRLDDAVAAAATLEAASGDVGGPLTGLDDRGVSLHVFARTEGEFREQLRFDCFVEDPHYHYISWTQRFNDMVHIDPIAEGDPVTWAIERIRTRLPEMFTRAGAEDAAREVDSAKLAAILPEVVACAERLRREPDSDTSGAS
jgi:hypothetical protein